jgi:ATP-dependent DNA helicase DinG
LRMSGARGGANGTGGRVAAEAEPRSALSAPLTESRDGRYTGAMTSAPGPPRYDRLPVASALAVGLGGAVFLDPDGTVTRISLAAAAERIAAAAPPLLCHGQAAARRLGTARFPAHDVLELFAFVRPARFCLPTARGMAAALGLSLPVSLEGEAAVLREAACALLEELAALGGAERVAARAVGWAMARGGWAWSGSVLAALGAADGPHSSGAINGLRVWNRLSEWRETPPEPRAGDWPVEAVEARGRLARFLGTAAENRPQQATYASALAGAFRPRDRAGETVLVLAEGGTGVGKTLGYLAPASVWVEKNKATVWISTFTRNLQRQLDQELDHLFPDPDEKAARVVIRKGRENYLCLLNLDEAVTRLPMRGGEGMGAGAVALGLVARWAAATRDGDMVGGDFPAWLADVLGPRLTTDLTDTRGECVFAACPHYRKCFVERSIRRARRADLVIANPALVMIHAAMGGGEDAGVPSRYIFDEGHHLFDAADAAFSAHLSGYETADLRRWLLGAEARGRSRSRGLGERIGDLVADVPEATEALTATLAAARILPGPGWRQRLAGGEPIGPTERFLARVRQQVRARSAGAASPYGLEAHTRPPVPGLLDAALSLAEAMLGLLRPMTDLEAALAALLDDGAAELDTSSRLRVESVCRGLQRRGSLPLRNWRAMLASIEEETPPQFFDWFSIDREDGRDVDVGLHRHWRDPMLPFAASLAETAHGMAITSASLRDSSGDPEVDWAAADMRTGASHFGSRVERVAIASPFDYAAQTRVLVVADVDRNEPAQVAAAYRDLFLASAGGALGLFTAIARLREVHRRIADPLDRAGLALLAQHVDAMDTATLIDIFRAEEDSCLLGTDAVRDGVDVPGRALRLIVFDRVPWPRPTLLHRARKETFGGRAYDEMLSRLRLKQAYGRLIRRATDRGVFVMLDRALPSRMAAAFPDGVTPERVGLAEAIRVTRGFLGSEG